MAQYVRNWKCILPQPNNFSSYIRVYWSAAAFNTKYFQVRFLIFGEDVICPGEKKVIFGKQKYFRILYRQISQYLNFMWNNAFYVLLIHGHCCSLRRKGSSLQIANIHSTPGMIWYWSGGWFFCCVWCILRYKFEIIWLIVTISKTHLRMESYGAFFCLILMWLDIDSATAFWLRM